MLRFLFCVKGVGGLFWDKVRNHPLCNGLMCNKDVDNKVVEGSEKKDKKLRGAN